MEHASWQINLVTGNRCRARQLRRGLLRHELAGGSHAMLRVDALLAAPREQRGLLQDDAFDACAVRAARNERSAFTRDRRPGNVASASGPHEH